jgi:hypothetical protein
MVLPRHPRRDRHGPHRRFEVPLALSLNHAELLAEALDLRLEQQGLADLPHLVTCRGLSLRYIPSCLVLPIAKLLSSATMFSCARFPVAKSNLCGL